MCSLMTHRPVPVNEKQKERHRFVSQSYEYRVCAVSSYTLRQNAKGEGMPTKVDCVARKLARRVLHVSRSLAALEKVVHVTGNLEPAFFTVRSVAHADAALGVWVSLVCGWQVCTGVSHR